MKMNQLCELLGLPELILNNDNLHENMIRAKISYDRAQAIRDCAFLFLVAGYDEENDYPIIELVADEIESSEEYRERTPGTNLMISGGWAEECEGQEALMAEMKRRGMAVSLMLGKSDDVFQAKMRFGNHSSLLYFCTEQAAPFVDLLNLDLCDSTGRHITSLCAFQHYDAEHFDEAGNLTNPESFYDSVSGQNDYSRAIVENIQNKAEFLAWLAPKIKALPHE
jgi:hypothetical protein